jgi:hypothetical protein
MQVPRSKLHSCTAAQYTHSRGACSLPLTAQKAGYPMHVVCMQWVLCAFAAHGKHYRSGCNLKLLTQMLPLSPCCNRCLEPPPSAPSSPAPLAAVAASAAAACAAAAAARVLCLTVLALAIWAPCRPCFSPGSLCSCCLPDSACLCVRHNNT